MENQDLYEQWSPHTRARPAAKAWQACSKAATKVCSKAATKACSKAGRTA
ncbi:MAG: hypothetical protein R3F14_17280 [Polyangiaceae bacterium]